MDQSIALARDRDELRRGEIIGEEESRLRTAVSKGATLVDRDRAAMNATRDKVAAYEEDFNKIRAATGIASIEELVATFIQSEVCVWTVAWDCNVWTVASGVAECH